AGALPSCEMLSPAVRPAKWAAVVLPPPLQAVNEALFDGGADMAVDAPHAGQPVAKPLCLDGFGNLIFEPGGPPPAWPFRAGRLWCGGGVVGRGASARRCRGKRSDGAVAGGAGGVGGAVRRGTPGQERRGGGVDLALQDGELMAQRQDLNAVVGVAHR